MEHKEAIEAMASERYLLGELNPAARDAFEDHMFGCMACAEDVRLGSAFLERAKVILPEMSGAASPAGLAARASAAAERTVDKHNGGREKGKRTETRREWFAWLRPAFAVPAFALLLATVSYQNLVTYPSLVAASEMPRVLPAATALHPATRGGAQVVVNGPKQGTRLTVDVPQSVLYASYTLELYDSATHLVWTSNVAAPTDSGGELSVYLPAGFKPGAYRLTVKGADGAGSAGQDSGVSSQGEYRFEVQAGQ